MKKIMLKATLALALMVGATTVAQGQMPIPVDDNVRIGKLENGLTYYIRHNEKPKGQADFYIAQKVGSALENDQQRGLAHFLEHMCFNGTKNFPGNELVHWLESVGVKFGANLNAYTGVDETVYNISSVPTAREGVQDSCLLILHDWADGLILDPAEIEKERGVIHQEWRRSSVGQMRILENILPEVYQGEKYGSRLPIGTMEVVDNFPPQVLRDYYETWYRPDQQGIIVVGDIDVDRIENKIKEIFSPIKMPAQVQERVYAPVSDNEETIFAMGKDAEQKVGIVEVFFKNDAFPTEAKGDIQYMAIKYCLNMIGRMFGSRFNDLMSDPDAAFAQAGAYYGEFMVSKTKDALSLVAVAKDNDVRPGFESAYRELLRAVRGGFTMSEYDRAREEYMSKLEKAYNDRNNRESESYVREYVRHFIDNEPIPSIEDEYQLMQMLANALSVEQINQILASMVGPTNRVVMGLFPDNDSFIVPTKEELAAIMAKVEAENIEPYVDEVKSEPLIPTLPTPGKVVAEKNLEQWGATELTLSNGVKVIVKPTTFKDNEILVSAIALGGTSKESDDLYRELICLSGDNMGVLSTLSLGDYTSKDLAKYMQGKQIKTDINLDDYMREFEAETTIKDLKDLMEVIYMTFTAAGLDEQEYAALQKMVVSVISNQEKDPNYYFSKMLMETLFDNPRNGVLSSEVVANASRENFVGIVNRAFTNAADYTFTFVGNVDVETLKPLLEQYIATLPADAATATTKVEYNPSLGMKGGKKTDTFTTAMQTPQTTAALFVTADMPFTAKDRAVASIAGQILSKRLIDTVREEMGAVYSIGASGSMSRLSTPNVYMQSSFPMKPEMKDQVLEFIAGEFKAMEGNITEAEVAKVVEYMTKNAVSAKEKNNGWLGGITGFLLNGVDTFNGDVEMYGTITPADVQEFMKKLNAAGNYRVVVLDPAE